MVNRKDKVKQPIPISEPGCVEITDRIVAAHLLGLILRQRLLDGTAEDMPFPSWILKTLGLDAEDF